MTKENTIIPVEHEVKILEIDVQKARERLLELDAQCILDEDTYIEVYDFGIGLSTQESYRDMQIYKEHNDSICQLINLLMTIKKGHGNLVSANAYLRIRREGEKQEIIFKQKISGDIEIKNEIEISIPFENWRDAQILLEKLGTQMVGIQEKHRESFCLNELRFDIDTWPGIPTYIEIEGPTTESIGKGISLLGYERSSASSIGGKELFDKYGVNYQCMRFNKK